MKIPKEWGSDKPYKIMDWMEGLQELPDGFMDSLVTSPPYWGLRDYGTKPIIFDAKIGCKHIWGNKLKHSKGGTQVSSMLKGRDLEGHQSVQKLIQGNFCKKCGAWKGELGLEPDFELYIKHLCDGFDEVKRVLKETGTIFVNIGDTYYGSQSVKDYTNIGDMGKQEGQREGVPGKNRPTRGGLLNHKTLTMIPFRFAIEMVNRGWILRNTIIWQKLSCMPSSARDRFTVDFEYIFFFVKSNKSNYWIHIRNLKLVTNKPKPDYRWVDHLNNKEYKRKPKDYSKKKIECPECNGKGQIKGWFGLIECDQCEGKGKIKRWGRINLWEGRDYYFEQQLEPHKWEHVGEKRLGKKSKNFGSIESPVIGKGNTTGSFRAFGEGGRNKRTTWSINPQSYPKAHFAVYPPELIEIPIKAGCPEFVCNKCGMPREKVFETKSNYQKREECHQPNNAPTKVDSTGWSPPTIKFIGWSNCGCNAGFSPGIVIDTFLGSGTTIEKARDLGRRGLGFELNLDYEPLIIEKIDLHQKDVMDFEE